MITQMRKMKRGLWSPEEDEKLVNYISSTHGLHASWTAVPKLAGLQRSGKSCRLRWINYLRPGLRLGSFSSEEAMLIINLHNTLGNKWAEIAKYLPGRTDSAIKNFCNSNMRKKLQFQKGFCNQSLDFDFILGQNSNPDNLMMQLEPNNWIFPFQLPMVNARNYSVPESSSLLVKHGQETETDLDVDLPALPPSFVGDSYPLLDHHPPQNFDFGQNCDVNHRLMQLEPSDQTIGMDLIIDNVSQPNLQFSNVVS